MPPGWLQGAHEALLFAAVLTWVRSGSMPQPEAKRDQAAFVLVLPGEHLCVVLKGAMKTALPPFGLEPVSGC